jgi:uncharacterized membrane protein (DUF2068 family)
VSAADSERAAASARNLIPWIVAFKALKTTTLTILGMTLLATRHDDPVDLVYRMALAVHLPLTSAIFDRIVTFATGLTMGKQIALAMTAFGYAVLMGTEGIGLYLRRPWARWFTVIATGSLIPIELYEIAREAHPVRVLVLLANIAIVVYLVRRRDIFEQ